jgi:protoheme IX farnesyltransferase
MARAEGGLTVIESGEEGRAGQWHAGIGDYFALLKPRVMSLVVFTGGVGLAAAPGNVDLATILVTLITMAGGAGGCGALNMWYDADIDAVMRRTRSRPIPQGRVSKAEALILGLALSLGSVAALGALVNGVAAFLLAFTIGFYVLVYTMGLKRRTPQNIVIGGASGALPPMIGWAAASGGLDAGALALFLIIFLWTPPHFWALAIARSSDYEKAGVPMMPVVAGAAGTARQILVYSALLVAASAFPVALGTAGMFYAAVAGPLGLMFVWRALDLVRIAARETEHREQVGPQAALSTAAMRLFGFSILYLFALYAALLLGAA